MLKVLLVICFGCIVQTCLAQQKAVDSLLNELTKHPQEDTVRLKLLNNIAYEYIASDPKEGIKLADAAIQLAGKLNNKQELAAAYLNKGINHRYIEDDSVTLQLYNQALSIAQQSDSKLLAAKVYHNIGIYYFDKSDYPKAIANQNQSLAMAEAAHDSSLIGNDYASIGVVYHYLSQYAKAISYQLNALHIFEQLHNKEGIASAYSNLGLDYTYLEQFPKALDYHKQAYEIYKQLNYKQKMADALGNEATIYDNMDDSAHALQLYNEALTICKEIGYKQGIANNNANIGILYSYDSAYYKAIPYLKESLLWYKKSNDKNNQAILLTRLGSIYNNASNRVLLQLGIFPKERFALALDYTTQSLAIAKEIKSFARQESALESMSEIYEKNRNYKKALDVYKQSAVMRDSMINSNKKQQITRLEMQYEFNKTQDSIKAGTDKQQVLAKAEIDKQHIINNSLLAGSGFLIITGLVGFLFYKRNQDIKVQRNEAELKAQVAETEMKALRAQMNPHFIFNSLNSISDYITKNDTKSADKYLTKFARVMRIILENSEQKEVRLKDDLKALELYMQLESLRLKNHFTYTIQVSEDIDQENTLIPPLLLQPFVENSIWHGIAQKEGIGHIIIYIKKEDNMLQCTIDDNGAGMQSKTIINKEKKSLGMRITKDRIDMLNKQKNANATMRVYGKEQGVRAEINLPLQLSF